MTVRDLLDAAYNRSKYNQPGLMATEATELLKVVQRSLRKRFAQAVRVNRFYFGVTTTVAAAAGKWLRPADAASIYRIEHGTVPVVVVDFEDPNAEKGEPSVYEFGQAFHPVAASGLAGTEALTFSYSRRASVPQNINAAVDPAFPADFHDLLILDVAIYLAQKDGRMPEVQALMAERAEWEQLYAHALEHATPSLRKRNGKAQQFNTHRMEPAT